MYSQQNHVQFDPNWLFANTFYGSNRVCCGKMENMRAINLAVIHTYIYIVVAGGVFPRRFVSVTHTLSLVFFIQQTEMLSVQNGSELSLATKHYTTLQQHIYLPCSQK